MENYTTDKTEQFEIDPHIGKLFDIVIPHMVHDISSAFMDLLDNSDDADAENMHIFINSPPGTNATIGSYMLADDGDGMNLHKLKESFRFATTSPHAQGDLGKFGVGGTAACFTVADTKTTITKTKDGKKILVAKFDRRDKKTTQATLRAPAPEEVDLFNELCPKGHGTITVLENLKEPMQYTRPGDLKNKLLKDIGTCYHLRLGKNKKIYVSVNGKQTKVKPVDPLFWGNEDIVINKYHDKIEFDGCNITLRFVELNTELLPSTQKGYNHQGIYIARSNRIIVCGGDLGLWKRNPLYNAGRVEISFTEDLDDDFGIGALKNSVKIKQALRDVLMEKIKKFRALLQSKYKLGSKSVPAKIKASEAAFVKLLMDNAGSLNLPRSSNSGTKPPSNGSGATSEQQRGTGNPRGSYKPRNRICPEFRHIECPRSNLPYWSEWEDENGEPQMVCLINTSNEYIKEYYLAGSVETQNVLRRHWAADLLAQWEFYDTKEFSTIQSLQESRAEKLNKLHRVI